MTAALDAIRALAEAATSGPWHHENKTAGMGYGGHVKAGKRTVADLRYQNGKVDGDYIAAVDPQTVLALLAALDRAEAGNAQLREAMLSIFDASVPGSDVRHTARVALEAPRAFEDADKVADG